MLGSTAKALGQSTEKAFGQNTGKATGQEAYCERILQVIITHTQDVGASSCWGYLSILQYRFCSVHLCSKVRGPRALGRGA